jgi:hypothetical protein
MSERWTTHNEEVAADIDAHIVQLADLIPEAGPKGIDSNAWVEPTTWEEAEALIRNTRRALAFNLLNLETHEHWLDDCGDDTQMLTDAWAAFRRAYFDNDADPEASLAAMKVAVRELNDLYGLED